MNKISLDRLKELRQEAQENANIAEACALAGEDSEVHVPALTFSRGYMQAIDDVIKELT